MNFVGVVVVGSGKKLIRGRNSYGRGRRGVGESDKHKIRLPMASERIQPINAKTFPDPNLELILIGAKKYLWIGRYLFDTEK